MTSSPVKTRDFLLKVRLEFPFIRTSKASTGSNMPETYLVPTPNRHALTRHHKLEKPSTTQEKKVLSNKTSSSSVCRSNGSRAVNITCQNEKPLQLRGTSAFPNLSFVVGVLLLSRGSCLRWFMGLQSLESVIGRGSYGERGEEGGRPSFE
jgi:hypothetical protein